MCPDFQMIAIPPESLYVNIQLSVLGIAVVIGFFFIWRILRRIESRLEAKLDAAIQSGAMCGGGTCKRMTPEEEDALLQKLPSELYMFEEGSGVPMQMTMPMQMQMPIPMMMPGGAATIICETREAKQPRKFEVVDEETREGDVEDVEGEIKEGAVAPITETATEEKKTATSTMASVTRDKLMKMSLDKLKDMAVLKGVVTSSSMSKKEIVDKILDEKQ